MCMLWGYDYPPHQILSAYGEGRRASRMRAMSSTALGPTTVITRVITEHSKHTTVTVSYPIAYQVSLDTLENIVRVRREQGRIV